MASCHPAREVHDVEVIRLSCTSIPPTGMRRRIVAQSSMSSANGSPRRLSEVFSSTGGPKSWPYLARSASRNGSLPSGNVCTRALPSACTQPVSSACHDGRTLNLKSIKSERGGPTKKVLQSASLTTGATGRYHSRCFTSSLSSFFVSIDVARARKER